MDVFQAIKTLRAVRQYTDQPVGEETLTCILEAGRWAGSAKNTQPWRFIVVRNGETLNRLAGCGSYASHLREAPLAIVVVSEPSSRGDFDSGRAIQNMMLAAWGDGVGSCIASMHREADAKRVLGIPDGFKLQQVVAFGYPRPGVVPTIEGKPLAAVLASTGRKPLADLVFQEKWGG
jgi:nitroreductase